MVSPLRTDNAQKRVEGKRLRSLTSYREREDLKGNYFLLIFTAKSRPSSPNKQKTQKYSLIESQLGILLKEREKNAEK